VTGLEPHPVLTLPTREQAIAMGPERFRAMQVERAKRLQRAEDDPLRFGYKPEIWGVVDDLLVDGNKVVLDLTGSRRLRRPGCRCRWTCRRK
jgi:hypothetical protein